MNFNPAPSQTVAQAVDRRRPIAVAMEAIKQQQAGMMTPFLAPMEPKELDECFEEADKDLIQLCKDDADQLWEQRFGREPEATFYERWAARDAAGELVVMDPMLPWLPLVDPMTGQPVLGPFLATAYGVHGYLAAKLFQRYISIKARKEREARNELAMGLLI